MSFGQGVCTEYRKIDTTADRDPFSTDRCDRQAWYRPGVIVLRFRGRRAGYQENREEKTESRANLPLWVPSNQLVSPRS
ncbi:MAG: hypothetical protein MK243_06125, partial [Gemmatimonadetes bacterium]|nr:hypothetical protein [Gemmatimonadota bacterium]